MNEKLEVILDAWRKEEALRTKHTLRASELWKLVQQNCKHEDGYDKQEIYFSGSYYDQAYSIYKYTCKICGHTYEVDSDWRGGYG